MDTWLAVVIGLTQLVLGAMGVYVSLRPPDKKYHWWWFGGLAGRLRPTKIDGFFRQQCLAGDPSARALRAPSAEAGGQTRGPSG